jgi:genome maintenance exonuclease 1
MAIPHNNLYTYPKLEQITLESGKRYYISPENNKLHSVTTILSATSDKAFLEQWRKRVGEKAADKETKDACAIGNLLHKYLENWIQGIPTKTGTNYIHKLVNSLANQIINKGLSKVSEYWCMEKTLFYEGLYAGTVDLIAVYNGVPTIIDYKNSKKIKKEEWIESYYCQLCAYSLAHNKMFNTDIKSGVVLMASRDGDFNAFELNDEKFQKYTNIWLNRLEDFLINIDTSK